MVRRTEMSGRGRGETVWLLQLRGQRKIDGGRGPRGQAGDEEEVVFGSFSWGAAENRWWERAERSGRGQGESGFRFFSWGAAEERWWERAERSGRGRGETAGAADDGVVWEGREVRPGMRRIAAGAAED